MLQVLGAPYICYTHGYNDLSGNNPTANSNNCADPVTPFKDSDACTHARTNLLFKVVNKSTVSFSTVGGMGNPMQIIWRRPLKRSLTVLPRPTHFRVVADEYYKSCRWKIFCICCSYRVNPHWSRIPMQNWRWPLKRSAMVLPTATKPGGLLISRSYSYSLHQTLFT